MSDANTGTPARANPSAITCSETVLPVPVAPVTRPCRLASESVSQAGLSPLPMKIFSAVSAILLSDAAIASPLHTHRGVLPSSNAIIPHSIRRLKPASGTGSPCGREGRRTHTFLQFGKKSENIAEDGMNRILTLALLQ